MSLCLYNKKNITGRLEDINFIFSWQKELPLENKIHIFVPPCNILYIFLVMKRWFYSSDAIFSQLTKNG